MTQSMEEWSLLARARHYRLILSVALTWIWFSILFFQSSMEGPVFRGMMGEKLTPDMVIGTIGVVIIMSAILLYWNEFIPVFIINTGTLFLHLDVEWGKLKESVHFGEYDDWIQPRKELIHAYVVGFCAVTIVCCLHSFLQLLLGVGVGTVAPTEVKVKNEEEEGVEKLSVKK